MEWVSAVLMGGRSEAVGYDRAGLRLFPGLPAGLRMHPCGVPAAAKGG